MSRLLLFLSLLGAAIYSLLIYTHDVLTDDKAEKTYAEQTQANHPGPHLSSWNTYLPDRKVSKDLKLATSQLSTSSCLFWKVTSLAKIRSAEQNNRLHHRLKYHPPEAMARNQSRS